MMLLQLPHTVPLSGAVTHDAVIDHTRTHAHLHLSILCDSRIHFAVATLYRPSLTPDSPGASGIARTVTLATLADLLSSEKPRTLVERIVALEKLMPGQLERLKLQVWPALSSSGFHTDFRRTVLSQGLNCSLPRPEFPSPDFFPRSEASKVANHRTEICTVNPVPSLTVST